MTDQDGDEPTNDGDKGVTRRSFVKGVAGGASALLLGGCSGTSIFSKTIHHHRINPSTDKLRIAAIGVGGKGGEDVLMASGERLTAFCDVDDESAAATYAAFPAVKRYKDYREMLEKEDKSIDAVLVSIPDHSHAPAAMMAIGMGKHVFCQKPLAHSIYETRRLAEAARQHGVVTQMGIQGHSFEGPRVLCEWIWSGAIGHVREVHVWTDRPLWPQGMDRPKEMPPVPKTLDWNLWLGPAPERPYNPCYAPGQWRGWWDFGCGALGDMGCHAFDSVVWALDLGLPTHIEAQTSPVNGESFPKWSIVKFHFPERDSKRGRLPAVDLHWYDGGKKPQAPKDLEAGRPLGGGHLFIGDGGTIMTEDCFGGKARIVPETKMRKFWPHQPPQTLPRSPGHMEEFIRGCKGGPRPGANFDYAEILTEICLLGNLAIRLGRPIEWDQKGMKVKNDPEASQYVRSRQRPGWEV